MTVQLNYMLELVERFFLHRVNGEFVGVGIGTTAARASLDIEGQLDLNHIMK